MQLAIDFSSRSLKSSVPEFARITLKIPLISKHTFSSSMTKRLDKFFVSSSKRGRIEKEQNLDDSYIKSVFPSWFQALENNFEVDFYIRLLIDLRYVCRHFHFIVKTWEKRSTLVRFGFSFLRPAFAQPDDQTFSSKNFYPVPLSPNPKFYIRTAFKILPVLFRKETHVFIRVCDEKCCHITDEDIRELAGDLHFEHHKSNPNSDCVTATNLDRFNVNCKVSQEFRLAARISICLVNCGPIFTTRLKNWYRENAHVRIGSVLCLPEIRLREIIERERRVNNIPVRVHIWPWGSKGIHNLVNDYLRSIKDKPFSVFAFLPHLDDLQLLIQSYSQHIAHFKPLGERMETNLNGCLFLRNFSDISQPQFFAEYMVDKPQPTHILLFTKYRLTNILFLVDLIQNFLFSTSKPPVIEIFTANVELLNDLAYLTYQYKISTETCLPIGERTKNRVTSTLPEDWVSITSSRIGSGLHRQLPSERTIEFTLNFK